MKFIKLKEYAHPFKEFYLNVDEITYLRNTNYGTYLGLKTTSMPEKCHYVQQTIPEIMERMGCLK